MNPRINRYAVHIRVFAHDDTNELESVLSALGTAARRAEKRISHAAKTHDSELLSEVFTEEDMLIEDLFGCAFVTAQTYITRIVSRIKWLHQRIMKQAGQDLKTTNAKKTTIIHRFCDPVGGTKHSKIELIDAFANYFKHHEEWPPRWDEANGQPAHTIRIIRSFGASEDSPDNCRRGLAALKIDPVFNVFGLSEILREWHSKLTSAYKQELRSLHQARKAGVEAANKNPECSYGAVLLS